MSIEVKTKATTTVLTFQEQIKEVDFCLKRVDAFERRKDFYPPPDSKWTEFQLTAGLYMELVKSSRIETNKLCSIVKLKYDVDIFPPLQYFIKERENPFTFARTVHNKTLKLLQDLAKKWQVS